MLVIIIGIILFMLLVLIHEFGHFLVAKKNGVKVYEFGIGIPPKIKTLFTDKSGTEYTLNAIPLGGFVRLKGEDPTQENEANDKDSFLTKKLRQKLLILVAGVGMNFVLAWLLFSVSLFQGIKPLHVIPENVLSIQSESYIMPTYDFLEKEGLLSGERKAVPVEIQEIIPDSIAEEINLQTGDIITKINGKEVDSLNLSKKLKENIGEKVKIKYKREENILTGSFQCPEGRCLLGIMLPQGGKVEVKEIKFGFVGAVGAGLHEIKAQTNLTFHALGNLGKKLISFNKEKIKEGVNKLSGPVGAVKIGEVILDNYGFWLFVAFGGLISLALAIFNFLPIPALDGGRALSILIQSIFKLKPEKYFIVENYINVFFFVLLMGLGIYIILLDLSRFWGVSIPGY